MTGKRKLFMLAMGLASELLLGLLAVVGNLPQAGVETLAWPIAFLTGAAMGANVGEHFAAGKPTTKRTTTTTTQVAEPAKESH